MDKTQIIFIVSALFCFAGLGFMMYLSIKRYEARPKSKKKKGRSRYMPQSKTPGRK